MTHADGRAGVLPPGGPHGVASSQPDAAAFAAAAHAGQLRKGTPRPYIEHPAAVAATLDRHYGDPDLVAAGWLHDVLEDTHVARRDLEARFGERVTALVVAVTRPRFRPWRLPPDADVARLKAADLLSNITETTSDLEVAGPEVWRRFHGGARVKLAYYADLVPRVCRLIAGEPLAAELADAHRALLEAHARFGR
jgi:hypothetical protein